MNDALLCNSISFYSPLYQMRDNSIMPHWTEPNKENSHNSKPCRTFLQTDTHICVCVYCFWVSRCGASWQ